MSLKIATLGLLKINVFWNKGYDVVISIHDATNNILLHEYNYIFNKVMWPKFANSSISMWESIISFNFIRIWPEKPLFLGEVLVQVQ